MIRNAFVPISYLPLLTLLVACAPGPTGEADAPASVHPAPSDSEAQDGVELVAVWRDGSLSTEALDQAILALPPVERQSLRLTEKESEREGLGSLHDFIRELAIDDVLIREAKLLGIDQEPAFRGQLRDVERNAVAERYLATNLPPSTPPAEDELRQAFDEQAAAMRREERRFVYNIFRRITPDATREDLVIELGALRERILAGEIAGGQGIGALAEKISDSESRHDKGRLGWFERGQLSPQLDEVIFGLAEGTPSEPIVTRDGVHLFYVDVVVDAKRFAFDEVRSNLATTVAAQRRAEAIATLVDELTTDFDIFMVTPSELEALHRRADPSAEVLRIGDFTLRLGQLVSMVTNHQARQPRSVEVRPIQLLESLQQAELIYQHQLAAGEPLDAEATRQMAKTSDRLLALHVRQEKIRNVVASAPEAVRDFFEVNRRRFSSPLEIKLERLSVPLREARAAQDMARLEQFRTQLEGGDTTLEAVAEALGGTVEAFDFSTLAELGAREPKLARFAPAIPSGHHSAPFSTPETLELVRVTDRREPEPLSFEAVRDQAQAAYLERNGQRLYEDLRAQILDDAGFRFLDADLERFVGIDLSAPQTGTNDPDGVDSASSARP